MKALWRNFQEEVTSVDPSMCPLHTISTSCNAYIYVDSEDFREHHELDKRELTMAFKSFAPQVVSSSVVCYQQSKLIKLIQDMNEDALLLLSRACEMFLIDISMQSFQYKVNRESSSLKVFISNFPVEGN